MSSTVQIAGNCRHCTVLCMHVYVEEDIFLHRNLVLCWNGTECEQQHTLFWTTSRGTCPSTGTVQYLSTMTVLFFFFLAIPMSGVGAGVSTATATATAATTATLTQTLFPIVIIALYEVHPPIHPPTQSILRSEVPTKGERKKEGRKEGSLARTSIFRSASSFLPHLPLPMPILLSTGLIPQYYPCFYCTIHMRTLLKRAYYNLYVLILYGHIHPNYDIYSCRLATKSCLPMATCEN